MSDEERYFEQFAGDEPETAPGYNGTFWYRHPDGKYYPWPPALSYATYKYGIDWGVPDGEMSVGWWAGS